MKNSTILKLRENFCGKVCTVLTKTIAKTNFQDKQFADFFTGIIESIDEDGIFAKHANTECMNFFPMQHVVGILEEQVILETDPAYEQIINEIKNPPAQPELNLPKNDSQFINPDFMEILAQNARQAHKK